MTKMHRNKYIKNNILNKSEENVGKIAADMQNNIRVFEDGYAKCAIE